MSIIGKLGFATKVLRAGRMFLRRLIDISTTVKKLHHHIDLNVDVRKDFAWWNSFIVPWNGESIIIERRTLFSNRLHLYTDASDIGFGVYNWGKWTAQTWPTNIAEDRKTYSIDWRELFAIYVAVDLYAEQFRNKRITIFTDNLPITQSWSKYSSSSPKIMTLMRSMLMKAAQNNFTLSLQHLPGIDNTEADLLSRMEIEEFMSITGSKPNDERIPEASIWEWYNCPY